MKQHVVIKSNKTGISLLLDEECAFIDIINDIKSKFNNNSDFWGKITMTLSIEGRKLTALEEKKIVDTITESSEIEIICIIETDKNRILQNKLLLKENYMKLNNLTGEFICRSIYDGDTVSSNNSVIVMGDVYEKATIEAGGNIIVLGELAGTAKAGCLSNDDSMIIVNSLNSDSISINSHMFKSTGKKHNKSGIPTAIYIENNQLKKKTLKKNFLDSIKNKKCW